jgi:hypothetical protein
VSYASLSDVNVHLPVDKLRAQDDDIVNLNVDAQRLIRARLAGTFDVTSIINTWVSPATTPEAIRRIAGKLIAAKFYANLVAEDEADGSLFAQGLYNDAIAELNDIRTGIETVIGVDGSELANDVLTSTSFYPNDTAPSPSFSVSEVWS